jgi:hypothetical protein
MLETWLIQAGFANVQAVKQILPLGPWPKDPKLVCHRDEDGSSTAADPSQKTIGAYNLTQLYEGMQGFSLRPFTKILGWTPEELEVLLMDVRKDLRNPNIHAMFD